MADTANRSSASNYWAKLKQRLKESADQLLTNCQQLKPKSLKDGKRYKTDWIHQRLLSIRVRNELTAGGQVCGVEQGRE